MVGVATAVTTTAAAYAPITAAAPMLDNTTDNAQNQRAADAADGTYESCAAYFGFGKYDGSLDIVEFDVADTTGGPDGLTHGVPSDTQVVLVLTNEAGDTLECTPVEVTETMWNDAMDNLDLNMLGISPDHPLPSWPKLGHYIYPSVNFEPYIGGSELERADDFGYVTAVGFKVIAIPDGHTLVSPTGVHPLDVHYPGAGQQTSTVEDPLLTEYLTNEVGAEAAAAFSAALVSCGPDGDESPDFDVNLVAAIRALEEYRDYGPEDVEYLDCWNVARLNGEVSFQLDLTDTVNYVEEIRLSLPPAPPTTPPTTTPQTAPPTTAPPTTTPATTTTTTSTTAPPSVSPSSTTPSTTPPPAVAPQAVAAKPMTATPTYTG